LHADDHTNVEVDSSFQCWQFCNLVLAFVFL
jgi:hypothetical protein